MPGRPRSRRGPDHRRALGPRPGHIVECQVDDLSEHDGESRLAGRHHRWDDRRHHCPLVCSSSPSSRLSELRSSGRSGARKCSILHLLFVAPGEPFALGLEKTVVSLSEHQIPPHVPPWPGRDGPIAMRRSPGRWRRHWYGGRRYAPRTARGECLQEWQLRTREHDEIGTSNKCRVCPSRRSNP